MTPQQFVRERAREVFAALDWFGRWCIHTGGTGFTTYEDDGAEFCAELNRLADAWAAEQRAAS